VTTAVATRGARVSALGTYAPIATRTNADLAKMVDTSDEWIVRRTGIRERHIARPDEFTSDLCEAAVRDLFSRSGVSPTDIELVIVGTTTPDYPFPSVAALIQDRLGMRNAGAIDIQATCAGFVYGVHLANGLVTAGIHDRVLVVAGETLSKVLDTTDRATCVLFGDGAGAALVEASTPPAIKATSVGADGSGAPHLYRTGLSTRIAGPAAATQAPGLVRQNGREVFRWAVETVSTNVTRLLSRAGLTPATLDWFVPHSANLRITEAVCERTGIPLERTLSSIECFGNTSAASIPLALAGAMADKKLHVGDKLLLYGFGGGLVHGGVVLDWTMTAGGR
jgi:3-oxoacyl-[acyl-carrier-protein] synthase III